MLDPTQLSAVELCLTFDRLRKVVGVTGPAGSGKTTIIKAVYEGALRAGKVPVVVAPTGKAAKRITEATGLPAMTIHRALKFSKPSDIDEKTGKAIGKSYPGHRAENPMPFTVVLADEYAMVSNDLHRHLVRAIPDGGFLRTFGDINQLPPIDGEWEPSPFEVILETKPSVTLTTIHRQAGDSEIPECAALLLTGRVPAPVGAYRHTSTEKPLEKLFAMVQASPQLWASLSSQILLPMKAGAHGTTAINQTLQSIINPLMPGEALPLPRNKWDPEELAVSRGDKIIWTQNDYELEVFNGETGLVKDWRAHELDIDFGDRVVVVPRTIYTQRPGGSFFYSPWASVYLAYAVTVHKAQGSEWDNVILALTAKHWNMLNKNLVYTGITRAKKNVHLLAQDSAIQKAVTTERVRKVKT